MHLQGYVVVGYTHLMVGIIRTWHIRVMTEFPSESSLLQYYMKVITKLILKEQSIFFQNPSKKKVFSSNVMNQKTQEYIYIYT